MFLVASVTTSAANHGLAISSATPAWLLAGLIAALMVAVATWRTTAHLRNSRVHRLDKDRLRNALDQIADGNFSKGTVELEGDDLADIGEAYGRMVPSLRSTIERLEWIAQRDPLTDMLNSASFKRKCQKILTGANGIPGEGALLFFDINDFKQINDSLGHEAGDRFLMTCADRVRLASSTFKTTKLAALAAQNAIDGLEPVLGRLGGDEFGVFLPGAPSQEDVERFIMRLQRLISEPCQIGSHSLRARISIGIAFSATHHNAYELILAAADTAMYEAKSQGNGGYCFYNADMRNKADRILERELELRTALQCGQFQLHFQPQTDLNLNSIDTAEALIRWQHPTRGTIMPGEFIPFAETYDLIDDIGDWVIHEAVKTASRWWENGRRIKIAVNISPKQFNRVELIPLIRACLARYDLPAEALEIEITEAAITRSDEVALERIEGLRRDGVAIALDDFGTGYSNLAQLLALPIDRLKLDRSMLESGTATKRKHLVVSAMVQLAYKLGLKVVAEGVETQQQHEFLREIRCHYAQGFLYSPPLAEDEFLALLDSYDNARAVVAS